MDAMARRPHSSRQTEAVLRALLDSGERWRHGYDLSRETSLKSGTLYPILIRLERDGWLEARWQDAPAPGRPRRHLYRLTPRGIAEANALIAEREQPTRARVAPAMGGAE
jgi:PadR family transcriptional regulator PadR